MTILFVSTLLILYWCDVITVGTLVSILGVALVLVLLANEQYN